MENTQKAYDLIQDRSNVVTSIYKIENAIKRNEISVDVCCFEKTAVIINKTDTYAIEIANTVLKKLKDKLQKIESELKKL